MPTPLNDDTDVLPGPLDESRDDDLARALAKAAPRHWWNKATVVLGAFALLVGGFVGGLQAQKHWGTAATTSGGGNRQAGGSGGNQNRAGYGNAAGGGAFGGGTFPGAGAAPTAAASAASAATTGTVKLVDGSTIYVQTATGDLVTVKTDAKTSVASATKGKISDVKAGQSVTVQGAAAADGTVTATTVTADKK